MVEGPTPASASAHPGPASSHPGPASVALPAQIVQELVDHARGADPNEACGVIIGDRYPADGGRALRFEPTRNKAQSAYLYEIDPDDLLRLTIETDDADLVFWAIVHSHTHTPARPSPTDIRQALYPDALYILVSLSGDEPDPTSGTPSVRAWRIVGGDVHEVELAVAR